MTNLLDFQRIARTELLRGIRSIPELAASPERQLAIALELLAATEAYLVAEEAL